MRINYTEKEKSNIERMVKEFGRIDSNEDRRKKLWWYSFASSIKDTKKVEQIMKDINAI